MKSTKLLLLLVIVCLQITSITSAQDLSTENRSIAEYPKHSIDLRFSMWRNSSSDVSVKYTGVSIDVGGGNTGGRIMYNYYPNSDFAFTFSAGVLSAQVNVNTISSYTSTIIPVMMGAKYFLVSEDVDQPFKPYLSGMVGLLHGAESGIKILSVNQHSETAMGGYFGIGTDVILGSLIKLHTDLGYNLFTEFKQPIGSKDNYSGPEFSFGIGFMF